MLGLVKEVKPFLKAKPKVKHPRADNVVFGLHYKVTFSILLLSSALVSSYNYFDSSGSAIQCYFDKNVQVPGVVINRYCWMMSTFTLPKYFEGERGEDFIHAGVGFHTEDDEKVYHAYYQWVPLFLSFQAIFFYAPHWIWKQMEGGRFQNLVYSILNEQEEVVKYLVKRLRKLKAKSFVPKSHQEHKSWALKFAFCECLNLANVIFQMVLTNKFLGGEFWHYGTEVWTFMNMEPEQRVDPMSRIFPRMTKCIFHKYGGSGTIQRFDALCVLGMNIINEKIFIFLWYWYVVLLVVTAVALLLRFYQFCYADSRERIFNLYLTFGLSKEEKATVGHELQAITMKLDYSDWLILYYLSQAMTRDSFLAFLSRLAKETEDSSAISEKLEPHPTVEENVAQNENKDGTLPANYSLMEQKDEKSVQETKF